MKNCNLFYSCFFTLFFIVLFTACNSSSSTISQDESSDSTKIAVASESVESEVEKTTLPFIEDNFSKTVFPLLIDTVVFEGKKKLPTDFIVKLEKMVTEEDKRYALQFPSFVKLNKLKKEQDPVESGNFDIGESILVNHYEMGYYFLEEQKKWLAFIGVEYESYPACPWGNGREIVLCTFDIKGNLIDLVTIAENSEGGDPPAWGTGEKKMRSQNGTEYLLEIKNVYGEYDDNGERAFEEIDKQTQKISIVAGGKLKIEEPKKQL
ncbi:hypothetical protein ACE193_06190 [Bernardetia sp. OM2101]|uniref:hypothetical protein n=1 Tax=Bernardetia sp. OM2101 TaxID=3344876 RepID=UPI0035CFFF9A